MRVKQLRCTAKVFGIWCNSLYPRWALTLLSTRSTRPFSSLPSLRASQFPLSVSPNARACAPAKVWGSGGAHCIQDGQVLGPAKRFSRSGPAIPYRRRSPSRCASGVSVRCGGELHVKRGSDAPLSMGAATAVNLQSRAGFLLSYARNPCSDNRYSQRLHSNLRRSLASLHRVEFAYVAAGFVALTSAMCRAKTTSGQSSWRWETHGRGHVSAFLRGLVRTANATGCALSPMASLEAPATCRPHTTSSCLGPRPRS